MGDGFLAGQIRRNARNLFLLGLVGLALVVAGFWANARYLYNFFRGPFPMDAVTLRSILLSGVHVTVQGDEIGFGVALGLTCLWCMGKGIRLHADPVSHAVWRELSTYGPPQQVGMSLDAEMNSEGGGLKFGAARVTSTWLVNAGSLTTKALRLLDLVWAYQRVVKHYHGFIPTGTTYSVIVHERNGQSLEVSAKKNSAPELLVLLQQRVPGMIVGYNSDLEELWRKHRREFLTAVDRRKADVNTRAVAAPATDEQKLVRA